MIRPRKITGNAPAFVALVIALSAGACSSQPTCNLPGPVTVHVDASTDGLPRDGDYGSLDACAKFCDPSRSSCQRLGDTQVRCSNDQSACL